MIIDGKNLILGRLATFATKKALEGESVIIVNCEKIIITGNKKDIVNRFKEKDNLGGPIKGPFMLKTPDRIVKRVIRGMLPYKQEKGAKAFKRIKCFIGVPEQYIKHKLDTVPSADFAKLKTLNFITVNDISKVYNKGV
jgi:large subunit ribosomal protein L13